MLVGENLHFNVPRPRQKLLQKDRRVTECGLCLSLRFFDSRFEFRFIRHDAHAAAAAAHCSLYDDWIADSLRDFFRFARGLDRVFCAGQHRNSGGGC